jgi:hypothetical protein
VGEGNLKAILVGTVTCEDLAAAYTAVHSHGLAVFGTATAKPLRKLQEVLSGGGEARFYFCAPTCALPHVAIAAGWVAGVWTEAPEKAGLAAVKKGLQTAFGCSWDDVVVGKEREALFRFWEGYVGVRDLAPHPEMTVARIREENPGVLVYEVLLG